MTKLTKYLSMILFSFVLVTTTTMTTFAKDMKDLLNENKSLYEKKSSVESNVEELNEQLKKIHKELMKNEKKLEKKEKEVKQSELDFLNAKAREEKQENAMKKRIQYLYENDQSLFEVFVESNSITDFVTKTEYVKEISKYDRDMLLEFEKVRKEVEQKDKELKHQKESLESVRLMMYANQVNIDNLISKNKELLKDVDSDISKNVKELNKYMDKSQRPGPWLIEGFGYLSNPCPNARISSEFGPRIAPKPGASTYHQGRDYAAPSGTPMVASQEGVVVKVGFNGIRGHYLVIKHPTGISTWYQHCTRIYVKKGDKVKQNQKIATVGETGVATGPHLHFIVEESNGKLVDPRKYL